MAINGKEVAAGVALPCSGVFASDTIPMTEAHRQRAVSYIRHTSRRPLALYDFVARSVKCGHDGLG